MRDSTRIIPPSESGRTHTASSLCCRAALLTCRGADWFVLFLRPSRCKDGTQSGGMFGECHVLVMHDKHNLRSATTPTMRPLLRSSPSVCGTSNMFHRTSRPINGVRSVCGAWETVIFHCFAYGQLSWFQFPKLQIEGLKSQNHCLFFTTKCSLKELISQGLGPFVQIFIVTWPCLVLSCPVLSKGNGKLRYRLASRLALALASSALALAFARVLSSTSQHWRGKYAHRHPHTSTCTNIHPRARAYTHVHPYRPIHILYSWSAVCHSFVNGELDAPLLH